MVLASVVGCAVVPYGSVEGACEVVPRVVVAVSFLDFTVLISSDVVVLTYPSKIVKMFFGLAGAASLRLLGELPRLERIKLEFK